ncbi:DUF5388 domain-containing protein [Limosilactobacillus reuteri]|uniref:DUF5388 domain-containing protein n=1 Tax=Limosilactobacillus reuteri TaxID=1598 RepID=A0AAW4X8I6_LIMRT|nr:DUF5388 domain-containing protein [Limosilactobacillus reuteri]MCC4478530.1 DUF5388 domain-containing protein [Limosilactobacillus reuteri]MCC4480438.1 DUF5388 domain-containing protein [Limosilactobacillus reuteri]MCC4498483.1 DUF5388 domain-containing protein [Limosilactobacillus reuteri]
MTKKNQNYTTSVSVSNVTRNKLIALSSIQKVTQKQLLSKIVDKEVAHLNPTDKKQFYEYS